MASYCSTGSESSWRSMRQPWGTKIPNRTAICSRCPLSLERSCFVGDRFPAEYTAWRYDAYTSAIKHGRIFDKRPVLWYLVGMKLSAYAKQQGISYQTAWRMWQRGELPAHQLPSGTLIVDMPSTPQA